MKLVAYNSTDSTKLEREIIIQPSPQFTLQADTTVRDKAILEVPESFGSADSYQWSYRNLTGSRIIVEDNGYYTVTVTDGNKCSSTKGINISSILLIDEVSYIELENNVITANGDNINDELKIKDLAEYEAVHLQVFNSWGDLVYENLNYNNDWTGVSSSGKPLDSGTYYLIIRCPDKTARKTFVDILR